MRAGIAYWASNSKDPILQRWGVGALARTVAAGGAAQAAALEAGGVSALVGALNCIDPQAQCFASAAIGAGEVLLHCRTLRSWALRSFFARHPRSKACGADARHLAWAGRAEACKIQRWQIPPLAAAQAR